MEKEQIEALNRAFAEFKVANDTRLAEIAAKGEATAETNAKVDRANADISTLQAELATVRASLREVETSQARITPVAGVGADADVRAARAYLASVRGVAERKIKNVTPEDISAARAYGSAFEYFLQHGNAALPAEHLTAIQNSMQTTSDPRGGYFVSTDMSGEIVRLIYETTPMRQLATVKTTSKDRIEGGLDTDEVEGGKVGETQARPETETAKAGRYAIVMGEFYANPKISQRLLDDADTDVVAWNTEKVSDKLSRLENYDFALGDGTLGPRGFLTYATGANSKTSYGKIQQIGTGASGAFATRAGEVNGADVFIDTVASMKTALRDPGCQWLMARLTLAAARKLKDGQGNYLWQPDFSKYAGGSILGYGVTEGEDMPAIGANSLSIAFANWKKGYVIYDHTTGMRVLRDPFTSKGWVYFYTTRRVGGDVLDFDAIKLIKFG